MKTIVNYLHAVCFVLILLGCSDKVPDGFGENIAAPINFVSYNIRYNNPNDDIHAWPNRKEEVINLLDFYEADIFGLQEVLLTQLNEIETAFPAFQRIGVGRDDGVEAGEFSPIFFRKRRFELLQSETHWLSETPQMVSKGWDAALERIMTIVKLKDLQSNQIFYVVNTHFDHRGEVARVKSAELINEITSNFDQVILMGDFNKPPESLVYSTLRKDYFDSYLTSAPRIGPNFTFSGFELKNKFETGRIDYIFTKGEMAIQRFAIITDFFENKFPSDHLPVFCQIILE